MARLKLILLHQVFLLCFIKEGNAQLVAASALLKAKDVMSLSPAEIFANPSSLRHVWIDEPVPLEYYRDESILAQRIINEKITDEIVTYSPTKEDRHEWLDIDHEEITPYTWKWINLDLLQRDGSLTRISLRRPNWWIRAHHADSIGRRVYVDLPEMGSIGWGIVTEITPNQLDTRLFQQEKVGECVNRPITGKFAHSSNTILNLHFEGKTKPLGVTSLHRLWSTDRNSWVEASNLLAGEKVKTNEGMTTLIKAVPIEGAHTVYNLEVFRSHNYFVSEVKVLAHNHCLDNKRLQHIVGQGRLALATKEYGLLKVNPGQGFINRGKMNRIYDAMLNDKDFWVKLERKNTPIIIHRFADGVMIVKDGHHRFLALSAASRVDGFQMPDLSNSKLFLIKDFSKSSTDQKYFKWDKLVEWTFDK